MARKIPFNWEAPFSLEDQLTEEERLVRDTARNYCQDKLQPRILSANREERFDREIMNELGPQRFSFVFRSFRRLNFELYW